MKAWVTFCKVQVEVLGTGIRSGWTAIVGKWANQAMTR
jgi:hypothetical protein